MKIVCAHCRATINKSTGAVNRARSVGAPLYCGSRCFGLARRKHKTLAQKKEEKRIYDAAYRQDNLATIKAKKAAHFQRTYDPVKAAVERKKRMPQHVEYCRRPEYRAKKHLYDIRRYHERTYGPWAEISMLARELNQRIKERMTNAEIKAANGTQAKRQKRAADEGSRAVRDRDRTTQRTFA